MWRVLLEYVKNVNTFSIVEEQLITHAYWDERFDDGDRAKIHEDGKLVYLHTIYDYSEMADWAKKGIDGFYTDYLVLEDYGEYAKYRDANYNEEFEEK